MMREQSEPGATVSLVVDEALSKLEALSAIADACGGAVVDAGTARARVRLGDGAWAEVEVPKFGDPPPLTIDVRAADPTSARQHAEHLAAGLERLGWRPRFLRG
ncbi:hypothetical protein [Agrococcus carbonis]|uniref:Uncharacterized protein n=1 Tax=Agrococcus carbonis TaxID=684552 RepID=A0A1H1NC78_9MICO|nr:hypothetical protein [Agrococcus carbonis]SDR96538.1 hypothetical protein SAMN04489719_1231 [Agrococcus carbonis]